MAKDIAQQIQSWLPSTTATDHASQQRILELETELAEVKATQGDTSSPADPPGTSDAAGMPPIQQALHGRSPSTSTFGSSSLLVTPVTVNPWLEQNQPTSLTDTNCKKWLKELKLPQPKADTLEKNLQKVMPLWQNQPDTASKTIQRVSVAMGLEPHKLKNSTTDELVIKVMTVALTVSS